MDDARGQNRGTKNVDEPRGRHVDDSTEQHETRRQPRVKRHRCALGIYHDRYGYSVMIHVGKAREERRFPHGTPLRLMQDYRSVRQAEMRLGRNHSPRPDPMAALQTQIASLHATITVCQEELQAIRRLLEKSV
jgi:hypothetical protein